MKTILYKVGRIKLILIITLTALIMAVGLNFLFQSFQEVNFSYTSLIRSALIPIIIAPVISWYLVGLFLQVIELEQTMKQWAMFDQLTGLLNRRAFLHRAEQEYKRAKRHKEEFAILVLDLDHFKMINDQYGHKAGDLILKDFGKLVMSNIRQSEICGRIGGEEFGFILPKTSLEQGCLFAEKLLDAIQNRMVSFENKNIQYTASIGITISYPENDFKINNLLHNADQALYQAKSAGRNCFQVAQPTTEFSQSAPCN
ncbi:GGDEF domain-containing protein [Kangiella shandongensis]|uniref:GGDEF domain-containing protein n=1 Tax=Kangiella shandongensis TaxID=2763258 RepID=UPI001CBF0340|nr:GGDEF domain-containing protein [Kangiella shandongensis]